MKYDYSDMSLEQLNKALALHYFELASCCFTQLELQSKMRVGYEIESMAVECVNQGHYLTAKIEEKERQISRLNAMDPGDNQCGGGI